MTQIAINLSFGQQDVVQRGATEEGSLLGWFMREQVNEVSNPPFWQDLDSAVQNVLVIFSSPRFFSDMFEAFFGSCRKQFFRIHFTISKTRFWPQVVSRRRHFVTLSEIRPAQRSTFLKLRNEFGKVVCYGGRFSGLNKKTEVVS